MQVKQYELMFFTHQICRIYKRFSIATVGNSLRATDTFSTAGKNGSCHGVYRAWSGSACENAQCPDSSPQPSHISSWRNALGTQRRPPGCSSQDGSGGNGNSRKQPKCSLIEKELNTFLSIHISDGFLMSK